MAFKKGDVVKVNVLVPQGPIIGMRMDDEGVISYLVEWVDGEQTHQRWYQEAELTAS